MKKNQTKGLWWLALMALLPVFMPVAGAWAQTTKVSGTILNAHTSEPVRGATIELKGKQKYTTTNDQGKYTIEAAPGNVLIITMVGFERIERMVGQGGILDIKLMEADAQLSDVVVIGYGQTKRKDVTGAISSISGEELRKTQPVTFDQALQGKVPGLVVQQISGQPGGAVSMQVRGLTTFGPSTPLYVIDGVIIGGIATLGAGTNPLAGINPSEIESIDVLKDAS
ncbi:MAG TPA: TonB-dependent receptor plug domain-containing protein, partial [Phnomibacter sp.]|nr:TonB-dependent receptor plug domain-containing protein [Phnomibacter sp.]